jgi:signal transduction histidine kinase
MNHERTTWLVVLFLLVGVLVPASSVVWFINESVQRETEAAHQTLTAAYREQLRLIRGRIDAFWSDRARVLGEQARLGGAAAFQRIIASDLADSVVIVDDYGVPEYPAAPLVTANEEVQRPDWQAAHALETTGRWREAAESYAQLASNQPTPPLAARAIQAEVRCLLKAGNRRAAVATIEKYFVSRDAVDGTDPEGRLIAADELFLALHLLRPGDARTVDVAERLSRLLNAYGSVPIPAPQRLFLMNGLQAWNPDYAAGKFPTLAAERLAATFLDAESVRMDDSGFHRSRQADVWTFVPAASRVVALYRTGTIRAALDQIVAQSSSTLVRFSATSPGDAVPDEAVVASPLLPDWNIAFTVTDRRHAEAVARRRVAMNAWIGFVAIAVVAGIAAMLGRSLQRQVRITRLKTDLVAAVSHELKTPLSSMRLLVDSLLEDRSLDEAKTREYLELIASENLRLSHVIANFLAFSRIERNGLHLDFAVVTPSQIVASVAQAMRERFPSTGMRFHIETEPDLPALRGDDHALVMALLNLLDNAHKYTPGDKDICLRTYREDSSIVFAVQDNGIGIAPREQKRIFRRFYRVNQSVSDHHGGSGLGLAIVAFVARSHGGAVTVDSTPGAGSTFKLSLPCHVPNGVAA